MTENLKDSLTQLTEDQIIIQRLRSLGLSIPSEELYTLIKNNWDGYIIGKYELLKDMHDRLVLMLSTPKAEVSCASVVYKKGFELNPENISVPVAFFSITMSIFSYFLSLGDLITALTVSLAVASTGYAIIHRKWHSKEQQENRVAKK